MDADLIRSILKENLIFPDLKPIDPVFYKNNKWKIEAAEKNRDEKINVKIENITLMILNKMQYGVSYSEKTEKYLSETIYPMINSVIGNSVLIEPSKFEKEPQISEEINDESESE